MLFLSWISFAATIILLLHAVDAVANILTGIDDNSLVKQNFYDPNAPFKKRDVSQATVWDIKQAQSFGFHFQKREDCQEVWMCTSSLTNISAVTAKDANSLCQEYMRFRPMEGSLTVGVKADGTGGTTSNYPWAHVLFKYDSKTKTFKQKIAKTDRDIAGNVKEIGELQHKFSGLIMIVTSSPYCQPIVQDDSGRPVSSVVVGDVELAFPRMRTADAIHEKTNNYLLVPTHITQIATSSQVKCPPLWLSEFDTTQDKWQTRSHAVKQKATFMAYKIDNRDVQCTPNDKQRLSFKLRIDDPKKCTWIRLCFSSIEAMEYCSDPKKSVELLLAYKMFVGIDSDEAQPLDIHSDKLKVIRFQLDTVGANNEARFTMSYDFASDEGGVQHHMFGDSLSKFLVGGMPFTVLLARDSECMARLTMDHLVETPKTAAKQCWHISDCKIVIPQKFASFPGSESIDIGDYNPDK